MSAGGLEVTTLYKTDHETARMWNSSSYTRFNVWHDKIDADDNE